ncbi:MAG: transposase, partial [Firmicutes bacterium]|nr:transposase [Bacillota bacterium]
MEIVVGWDWADGHHDVVVQDRPGHTLWAGQVAHTREALEALEGRLLTWAQQKRTAVHVVIETSQGLVVDWLSTTGFWVYPVNPKVSDARRKPSGAKTDRLDAAILARLTHQLLAALKSYYPQVLAAFADINRPVALAFLARWPDPQDARRLTVSEVMTWLRQHRYPRAAQEAPRIWSA